MNALITKSSGSNYRMRLIADLAEIGQKRWDELALRGPYASPFLRFSFLSALHDTGCASQRTGWEPRYLTLWCEQQLVAAAPLYRKAHSYGEYVFDWAWAAAYEQAGLDYYPKLLCAIPFTPVSGTRLLAKDDEARNALAQALVALARAEGLSSLHVLYPTEAEAQVLADCGMMLRDGVQFHWTNPGYTSFEEFLATLERKKRKNIRAERKRVAAAGVTLARVRGEAITDMQWQFFSRCYQNTYRAHYSTPYLNQEFFRRIGAQMPENLLLVIAEREARPIACSLVVITADTLYGRYWGEVEHVPCLHFECAYYQPLEYCIEQGLSAFEGGAQGEHKMARGFLPVRTRSAHWLAHPAFSDAVERFLERESMGIDGYIGELNEHNPFKPDPIGGPPH